MSTTIETAIPTLNRDTGASWEPADSKIRETSEEAIGEKEETFVDYDVLVQ
jgi:hypothetical protein